MTEKEIRDYFDDMYRQKGLGQYAKEKQEMNGFVSDEKPDSISSFERRQLRAEAVVLAGSQGYKRQDEMLKAAENIFQWIIKPE